MNYNKTTIGGNLTRDPEIRVTPKGTAIAQFTIAINRKWKDESQQEREEVSFIDCEAWGKTGENIAKFFTKGRAILCDGRLKQDTWEDKNTKEKRSKLKVVVDQFYFVDSKEAGPKTAAPATRPVAEDEDCPY